MSKFKYYSTFILIILPLFSVCKLYSDAVDRAWQTALNPVTLSLRNKLLNDDYTVKFTVKSSTEDKQWSCILQSEPNAWNHPQFPNDFDGPTVDKNSPQEYSWSAHILEQDGKRVLGGRFIYPSHDFGNPSKTNSENQ